MADIPADGNIRVTWVTSISNQALPTASELNAGLDLTTFVMSDGLTGLKPDTADVPADSLASLFNATSNGRTSFSGTQLTIKKQTGTDTVYNTLTRNTSGFLVVRRSVAYATAFASGQALQVYPALCEETAWEDYAPNTLERYTVGIKITAGSGTGPSLRAAVA